MSSFLGKVIKPASNIGKGWLYALNYITIKYKKVSYASFPRISGRLLISNKGHLAIGSSVTFTSDPAANMVGLFKPCSLAVLAGATLEIGDHSGFSGVSIYCSKKISIGSHVNCGGNVCIWDNDFHPLHYLDRRADDRSKIGAAPIMIGDDVFIGANSIILKGVTIGARAIVGAGSVVTKNIPPDEIWAGNPAKMIRKAS
ncbi:acyltransferase [Taibaiella helva]|uniref:acyltransferase n=1 Tax=Taibaiella helva TaxID=2301235 RepID=UPI000E57EEC6|nr:acyltransferase [Taibaiella helva]